MQVIILVSCIVLVSAIDTAENCATLKREERCASIFEDKTNCQNATYREFVQGCLVTCESCDAFSCKNPQLDSELNCTALRDNCGSPNWHDIMKMRCPSTCGLCNVKNAVLCNDREDSLMCGTMSQFCNSVDYYNKMTDLCASTCNRCPNNGTTISPGGETCMDKAIDCKEKQNKCNIPEYISLMSNLCASTCGTCGSNSKCLDKYKQCPMWASKGFCTSNTYDDNKKKDCAYSCHLPC